MSSLHDPFDLLGKDKEMDNVIPFLAPNKIDQMIASALTHKQLLPEKKFLSTRKILSGGLAIAASLVLWVSVVSPLSTDNTSRLANTDFEEFNELAMLDSWERY